jgi:hypothetical protein
MATTKWTAQERHLLGKRPDRELAEQFGRSVQAILTKRILLGIPRFIGKGEPHPWTPEEDALLGTAPDYEIARRLNRTAIFNHKTPPGAEHSPFFGDRPWNAKEDKLLATSTDKQSAHELGRSTRRVRERRRKLGILPWIYARREWTVQEERMLGRECDYTVAKRLDRTVTSVFAKRRKFGLIRETKQTPVARPAKPSRSCTSI